MLSNPGLRKPALSWGRPAGRYPAAVVAVRTARQAVRSGALWGYAFGLTVASSAWGYTTAYRTPGQRARFAGLFGSNAGLAAVNGPARAIGTVAGYTAWKSLMFLAVIGALWGLLAGTRLLRGEEDAGRWELLLAGPVSRRGAAVQALGGLACGLAALWSVTALITVAAGQLPRVHIAVGAMLFYALALAAPAAMFLAIGALASQLAPTRRQAAGCAGAVLGASYALRMVADSGAGLAWLDWATPLGWVEELRPLAGPRPVALLPIAALTAAAGTLAVYLAGRRAAGAGVWAARGRGRPGTWLLAGPAGLAARLTLPAALGWAAGTAAWALLLGFLARPGARALTGSPGIEAVVTRLGGRGGGAAAFLGFTFLTVAWLLALIAAAQVAALREEEARGRLEALLVRLVARSSWLAGRIALAVAILVGSGLLAGLLAWAGAASQDAGVSLASLLGAGLNVVPPALCVLGLGVLAMGAWPRAAVPVTYGVLTWSVLITVTGGFVSSGRWLLDTSVFHYLTAAPAASPGWRSSAILIGIGAAADIVGGAAFLRRDVGGE
jgi:ABC-2 type transport system permease protein